MLKVKEYIEKHKYIDLAIIALVMLLFSFLYSNHFLVLYTDRGREFLLPQEILNGAVPYKDITLIYFPLAYYINALIYKILGVSINSLLITQTIFCTFFAFVYYFIASEFLNRKTSLLLTILIISCCIFCVNDLFGWIVPYTYSRVYGLIAFTTIIYAFIKLFKTNKLFYLYFSAFLAGFSICCKLEFLLYSPLIIILGLSFYKKLPLSKYIYTFSLMIIFPIIMLCILFFQGVSLSDLSNAIDFGYKFASSGAMTKLLTNTGLYPFDLKNKLTIIMKISTIPITIIFICFCGLKLKQKYTNALLAILTAITIWIFFYDYKLVGKYFGILPYILLVFTIINFKNLITQYKVILFLFLCSLIISQREFTNLNLTFYGAYAFPLLILSICIIIDKFAIKSISNISTTRIMNFVLIIFIGFYINSLIQFKNKTSYKMITNKGTVYTDLETFEMTQDIVTYIINKTKNDDTILVLPEGNFLNFITDRKVNLKCFMMDRLYHDAYGPEIAKKMIEQTNSNYIILLRGLDLSDFQYTNLYNSSASLYENYIIKHYHILKIFIKNRSLAKILKKNNKYEK